MNKNIIFLPTYNEYPNIKYLLTKIKNLKLNLDILIIDDNSSDGTKQFLKNYKKKNKIYLIFREQKLGLDTATKLAFNFAKKKKYRKFISMDADLSHDPKMIPLFLKSLETEMFVIGSRYIEGGKCDYKGYRYLLSYYGNKFIKFIFNININEFTTSYRGFRLDLLSKINFSKINSKGYSFYMEAIFLLNKNSVNIKEIPIHFKSRLHGKSKIPKIELLRTIFNLFRLKISNL
jgi:dolichol-phosphate mannosyltransferase